MIDPGGAATTMIAVNHLPRRCVRPLGSDLSASVPSAITLLVDQPAWGGPTVASEAPTSVLEPVSKAGAIRLRPYQRIGPYRLVSRLGRGAQGEVWKAVGETTPGYVALKVLAPGNAVNPRRLAQFRREAERGARLAGPSLLRIADAGEADGCLYMAMPYVEAVTLQDVIRERRLRRRGLDPEPIHPLVTMSDSRYYLETTRILAGVARALHGVHAHRVVHRDVKPGNILLERRAPHDPFLCDLGLGRDLDHATADQMRDGAGTLPYMAPERLLKAPADEVLSDVYSMGATAFEALTLERRVDMIRDVPAPIVAPMLARARPRAPRIVDPNLPPSLEPVLLRALSRSPRDRHQSAGEFADALEAILPAVRRDLGILDAPRPHVLEPRHFRASRPEVR